MKPSQRTIALAVSLATALPASAAVDFVKDIQPIFEQHCVGCHREGNTKGGLRMDTKAQALKGGESGDSLVPGKPDKSFIYTTMVLDANDDLVMPPKKKGGPLPKEKTDLVKQWIQEGAQWPDNLKLITRKIEQVQTVDEAELVASIHKRITETTKAIGEKEMKPYTEGIPGSDVTFNLVPIPSGGFLMGSPDGEDGRNDDEGPQRQVKIAPFWMGTCEVTWNEFELFMYLNEERRIRATKQLDADLNEMTDAVTHPTQPYVEMSFGMGKDGFPAISMTQHAANKYCQWLSAKTGHFYRLPTEAEWEYAARAGTKSKFFWGDDDSKIGDYAWWSENSSGKYQKVGKKKPNPWGLYDIIGNVVEWTLDQYDADFYKSGKNDNPWNKASKPYPHSARGGAWDDDSAEKLRVAARRASNPDWKIQDPQFPKSIWYHTDAQFLGFRVVRPLETPSKEDMQKYWNSGVEKE
jgi:formylglycine-generating enzyme required for sulfatase activity